MGTTSAGDIYFPTYGIGAHWQWRIVDYIPLYYSISNVFVVWSSNIYKVSDEKFILNVHFILYMLTFIETAKIMVVTKLMLT